MMGPYHVARATSSDSTHGEVFTFSTGRATVVAASEPGRDTVDVHDEVVLKSDPSKRGIIIKVQGKDDLDEDIFQVTLLGGGGLVIKSESELELAPTSSITNTIPGTVGGNVVQTRDVFGGLHIYNDKK